MGGRGGSASKILDRVLKDRLDAVPNVGLDEPLNQEDEISLATMAIPWNIKQRLSKMRVTKSDDEIRNGALKKFKALILLDPEATALGVSLVDGFMRLCPEEELSRSISDALRSKASSTLQKRAASLQSFVTWAYEVPGLMSPWRVSEQQMYRIFHAIRESDPEPTSISHMQDALRFLGGAATFKFVDLEVVLSSRCRGIARDMYLTKTPLKQRDPVTLKQLRALEGAMDVSSSRMKCFVGQFLFCIHSCARWSDSQRLKSLEILGNGPGALILGQALGSKSSTKEAQTKFLPCVGLARGVSDVDWATPWLQARQEQGLDF